MDFKELQEHWNALGEIDPFWAILSDPDKVGNKWDVAEFFSTGTKEISEVMAYLESLGVEVRRRRALDFGCGAGRLSQALCEYFDSCDGVDVAPSMIDLARRFNRQGERCRYHLNQQPTLQLFESRTFDFIYCNIVLQHMTPEYSLAYVRDFLRVLDVDGLAVFQIPSQLLVSPDTQKGAPTALPDEAFRAKLRLLDVPPRIAAASRHRLKVSVRNVSEHVWPALGEGGDQYPVRLGNRWRTEIAGTIVADDGRADLDRPLGPGEQAEVQIVITTPRAPGTYRLEVDLVQEFVAWFRDKGSFAVQSTVVVDGPPAPGAESQVLVPSIEMHGVPRETVEEVVGSAGGELLDVREDDWAGAGWRSLRYCVRKPR
jgi:ubiquinone/menaquinone biosynthesis C-methylase UbiE